MGRACDHEAAEDRRYTMAELFEIRRLIIGHARSLPPGPKRNELRQIASSLRRLFRDKVWLAGHTFQGPVYQVYTMGGDGHFLKKTQLERANDGAAVQSAKQYIDGHDIELWQGDRKVAGFEHKPE